MSGSAGTGAAGSRALLRALTQQQPRVLLAAPKCLASSTLGWFCSLPLMTAALCSVLSWQMAPGFVRASLSMPCLNECSFPGPGAQETGKAGSKGGSWEASPSIRGLMVMEGRLKASCGVERRGCTRLDLLPGALVVLQRVPTSPGVCPAPLLLPVPGAAKCPCALSQSYSRQPRVPQTCLRKDSQAGRAPTLPEVWVRPGALGSSPGTAVSHPSVTHPLSQRTELVVLYGGGN